MDPSTGFLIEILSCLRAIVLCVCLLRPHGIVVEHTLFFLKSHETPLLWHESTSSPPPPPPLPRAGDGIRLDIPLGRRIVRGTRVNDLILSCIFSLILVRRACYRLDYTAKKGLAGIQVAVRVHFGSIPGFPSFMHTHACSLI